jgi:hypothetical protein
MLLVTKRREDAVREHYRGSMADLEMQVKTMLFESLATVTQSCCFADIEKEVGRAKGIHPMLRFKGSLAEVGLDFMAQSRLIAKYFTEVQVRENTIIAVQYSTLLSANLYIRKHHLCSRSNTPYAIL